MVSPAALCGPLLRHTLSGSISCAACRRSQRRVVLAESERSPRPAQDHAELNLGGRSKEGYAGTPLLLWYIIS